MRRRLVTIAAVTLLGLSLAACGDDSSGDTAEDPAPTTSDSATDSGSDAAAPGDSALPEWAPKVITDADDSVTGLDFSTVSGPCDQLEVAQARTGDGPVVEQGQTITANYFGQLADKTEPFDESFSSSPFQAPIGVGSLIPGWDQGIPGVPVGSRLVMCIPPDLGYGDAGAGADIPGGSTLYFVVDIIDAQ